MSEIRKSGRDCGGAGVRRDSLAGVLFCNIEKEFKITSRRRGGRGACAGIRLHRGDAEVAEAGAEGRIDLAFPLENLVSDPSAISAPPRGSFPVFFSGLSAFSDFQT